MRLLALTLLVTGSLFVTWRYVHADESPVTSCGPGRGHDCHCPRMVARRRAEDTERCMAIQNKHEQDLCLAEIPTLCEMVAHPRHTEEGVLEPDICYKYCRYQDLCFCNDTRCTMNGDPLPTALPDKFKHLPHAPKGKK